MAHSLFEQVVIRAAEWFLQLLAGGGPISHFASQRLVNVAEKERERERNYNMQRGALIKLS